MGGPARAAPDRSLGQIDRIGASSAEPSSCWSASGAVASSTGTTISKVEFLALARVNDFAFATGTGKEAGAMRLRGCWVAERLILCTPWPAFSWNEVFQPLKGQGEMGAALGRGNSVNLIDGGFDRGEDVPAPEESIR